MMRIVTERAAIISPASPWVSPLVLNEIIRTTEQLAQPGGNQERGGLQRASFHSSLPDAPARAAGTPAPPRPPAPPPSLLPQHAQPCGSGGWEEPTLLKDRQAPGEVEKGVGLENRVELTLKADCPRSQRGGSQGQNQFGSAASTSVPNTAPEVTATCVQIGGMLGCVGLGGEEEAGSLIYRSLPQLNLTNLEGLS
ncbi:hypothetical protein SKAU_G00002850 [Synaphobranchus kaupii]|uniref:Uncharacterized protein n=1 Tax=Synaphobranchus kaupii TaxID=118154 RepID=A0A9Q1G8P6_SYNKA|nr:hypothetical protein SKAU_G00002850 [Synaphobranchus kaupii]